jgi:type III pantothenate kinase
MEWCVDMGNTSARVACFEGTQLVAEYAFRRDEPAPLLRWIAAQPMAEACIVSNVGDDAPPVLNAFRAACRKFVSWDDRIRIPLSMDYQTPQTLGRDRVAAAVGAQTLYPDTDVLIVDAGTAITIDLLTADGHFRGGVISPGLNLRFRALHEFTARLPMGTAVSPVGFPATTTPDAVNSGVVQGAIYELDGYISSCLERYPGLRVLLTGGDANFFADQLKNCIFVVPKLVYTGLHRILQHNASC